MHMVVQTEVSQSTVKRQGSVVMSSILIACSKLRRECTHMIRSFPAQRATPYSNNQSSRSSNSFCLLSNSCRIASASRLSLSFLAALSSCDIVGFGDGPPLPRDNGASEGSMLASSVRGLRMEEMAFGR